MKQQDAHISQKKAPTSYNHNHDAPESTHNRNNIIQHKRVKRIKWMKDKYNANFSLSAYSGNTWEKKWYQNFKVEVFWDKVPYQHNQELAGCGIKYSWGKIKMTFRRDINDTIANIPILSSQLIN